MTPRRPRGDAGLTLMEMVVAMAVTMIALSVVAVSFVAMFRSMNKNESLSTANSQVNMAFNHLDSSVRYAADISAPGAGTDGNWYVEWGAATPATPDCTQLRLDAATSQLQQRVWSFDQDEKYLSTSSWQPIASDVTLPEAVSAPFALTTDSNLPYQQLAVHVTVGKSENGNASPTDLQVTFTALNSHLAASAPSVCTKVSRP